MEDKKELKNIIEEEKMEQVSGGKGNFLIGEGGENLIKELRIKEEIRRNTK